MKLQFPPEPAIPLPIKKKRDKQEIRLFLYKQKIEVILNNRGIHRSEVRFSEELDSLMKQFYNEAYMKGFADRDRLDSVLNK